jgi:hypothetical protein
MHRRRGVQGLALKSASGALTRAEAMTSTRTHVSDLEFASRSRAVLVQAAQILRQVAAMLGLDRHDAEEVAKDGLIALDERLLSVTPVVREDGPSAWLITLITNIADEGEHDALVNLLQHVPGLLVAHRAALGMSPEGKWLVHRSVDFDGMDPPTLMRELLATRWLEALLARQSVQ